MAAVASFADVVIAQDFFPMIGGAHHWLYEVYRRWPSRVALLTRAFDRTPLELDAQRKFDAQSHGALQIVRADVGIDDINLFDVGCLQRFGRVAGEIGRLRAGQAATVHCLRAFPEGFAGLLAKIRRPMSTRLVVFAHGEEMLIAAASRQLKLMAAMVYRHADLVIANSQSTVRLLKQLCPSARVVCIHPGVDVARFAGGRAGAEALRASWGWPAGTIVASTVARMEPRKNQAAVLRAIATLRSEGIPLAWVCGGDGEERERLATLVRELDVAPWVRFTGRMSEDEKVLTYRASDFFVMPSIRCGELLEGFGIVFLEAAAAGIPAISGCEGGQPEAVVHERTGLVVDGTDDAALRDAMRRLASDAGVRERMGLEASQRVRGFDWAPASHAVLKAVESRVGAKGLIRV